MQPYRTISAGVFVAIAAAVDAVMPARRERTRALWDWHDGADDTTGTGYGDAALHEYGDAVTVVADRRAAYSLAHGAHPDHLDADGSRRAGTPRA